jgi:hypothetical protein
MYCKQCGHRTDEKSEDCPKCGARFATAVATLPSAKRKVRWQPPAAAAIIGVILFVIVPRYFFRTDAELIEPTTKLRFLRALSHSDYRKMGQRDFRVEGQSLIINWDLRWSVLPEPKQREIVRVVGRAWQVVGGEDTRFLVEGEDETVASYKSGEVQLSSP